MPSLELLILGSITSTGGAHTILSHPLSTINCSGGVGLLGGFDVNKYETVRPWATARDGTRIPISIIYRKDLVKLDGTDLLFLSGSGLSRGRFRTDGRTDGRTIGRWPWGRS
jgi:hypothetical protein